MKRRLWFVVAGPIVVVLWVVAACDGLAQAPGTPQSMTPAGGKLEFEVASVRQNKSDDKATSGFSLDSGNIYSTVSRGDVFIPSGGYFSATNQPLWRYIVFAYKLTGTQELALRFNFFAGLASNVPGWVNTERFDIRGRVEGNPTKDQVRMMMQALLAERFKLVVHKETRQVPVLALVLVKPGVTGPRLQPHPADESCPGTASEETAASAPPPSTTAGGFPVVCGVIAHLPATSPGRTSFGGRDVPLSLLASSLPTQTGMATLPHPVIDETGLGGTFDFRLEWLLDSDPPADASGPTFVQALKEQLGLKLESQKRPVELIILDHLEHPSAN
jgi:uncharacterized protein (TIGR03435 family)